MRFFVRHARRRAVIDINQDDVLYLERDHKSAFYKTMKLNKFKKKYPEELDYYEKSEKTTLKADLSAHHDESLKM